MIATRFLAVLLALGALSSCGPTTRCSSTTCSTGCCDEADNCLDGASDLFCGSLGNACTGCALGTRCVFGRCEPFYEVTTGGGTGTTGGGTGTTGGGTGTTGGGTGTTGGGTGTAGGGTGTTGGGTGATGGGTASCGASNCFGCCLNGSCYSGSSNTQCGSSGNVCQNCASAGASCSTGVCVAPPACNASTCSGCCSGGTCFASSNSSCGGGGNTCQNCASFGQTCSNGACVPPPPTCSSQTCSGCCSGGTCRTGSSDTACGSLGQSCRDCTLSGLTCSGGSCVTPPPTCGPLGAVNFTSQTAQWVLASSGAEELTVAIAQEPGSVFRRTGVVLTWRTANAETGLLTGTTYLLPRTSVDLVFEENCSLVSQTCSGGRCSVSGEVCSVTVGCPETVCGRGYTAQAGTLSIQSAPRTTTGTFSATANNVRFVEWNWDTNQAVPGGRCLEASSVRLNSLQQ